MEKNLLLDDFWTDALEAVCEHIKHNCDPEDYDNGDVLDGIAFQQKYERLAFEIGGRNWL